MVRIEIGAQLTRAMHTRQQATKQTDTAENYLVPLGVVRTECALDWNRAREGDTTIDQQQPHIPRGIGGIAFH